MRSLAELEEDWDGEGASPISEAALNYSEDIIRKSRTAAKYLDYIAPTAFGSVILQWKRQNSIINAEIAENGIGFYSKENGHISYALEYTEDIDFALEKLLEHLVVRENG